MTKTTFVRLQAENLIEDGFKAKAKNDQEMLRWLHRKAQDLWDDVMADPTVSGKDVDAAWEALEWLDDATSR